MSSKYLNISLCFLLKHIALSALQCECAVLAQLLQACPGVSQVGSNQYRNLPVALVSLEE